MSGIHVCFNTFWSSFDTPGGGEVQLLQTKAALEASGVRVSLFDLWKPELDRFDVIHSFTVQPGMSYFAEFVRNRGKRLVVSPIFWPRAGATRGEMWEIERTLRFADLLLPNSRAEAELLTRTFDLDPKVFHVVHNGVDLEKFKPASPDLFRNTFGLQGEFLLCVGNVEPRKNQLRVLEAMKAEGIRMPLVCVGNVRDENYRRECEKHGELFRHVGPLPYASDTLCSAYAAASGFVLVSLFETPGLSAMEALHLGCPVLVTDRGSTVEYFAGDALYADPEKADSIAAGLRALVRRRADGFKPGFQASRYSWATVAQQTQEAYRKVMGK